MAVDFFFAKIFGKTLIEEIKREEKDTQRNISKKPYFTKIFGFPAFFKSSRKLNLSFSKMHNNVFNF